MTSLLRNLQKIEPLWFWMIGALWSFYEGLSSYGLLNNNEGLYAQIAWEMLENKSFIIPTLNGVPYIEKPPLLYWLIALSYSLFGKSVWAARCVPATFGCLTAFSLFFFYRSLGYRREGFYATMILASSLGFLIFSRMIFFDGLLTAFLTFSLLSFYLWQFQERNHWKVLFYTFLGGAVLAKGLLSLCLVGLITAGFLGLTKGWKALLHLFDPLGLLIFALITIPWHGAASLQLPEFSWFYFINEHILRFLDQRLPRDYYRGPFYYYLIRLPAYFLPWTFFLPFWGKKTSQTFKDRPFLFFVWLWFLIPLAFFTLSKAKANYYMMVGMPPLALLLVEYGKDRLRFDRLIKIGTLVSGVAITAASFIIPYYESSISCKQAGEFLHKYSNASPIYLYKRFEQISSIVFYHGKPIPILDSESADLAFGASLDQGKSHFLTWEEEKRHNSTFICLVCPRDKMDFHQKTDGQSELLYQDPSVLIYQVREGREG